jgi:hypothetical protein
MLLKKVLASTVLASCALASQAQDSTKSLTISGSVDAYYRYNGGKDATNNLTSFTNSANSFELGMASVRADATAWSGKVGATVDLGYGNRAKEFSYNDDGGLAIIKQAFVTYAPTVNLKFTAGKFGTHVGYEVLDPFANRNYSMGYMFSYGPFFHTGIKADITAGKVGFMLGVAQHVDQSTFSGSTSNIKDLLAQVSVAATDKWKFYLNYWGFFGAKALNADGAAYSTNGAQSTSQLDLVVLGTISDKFSVGVNGTLQSLKFADASAKTESKSWYGGALYLNYDPISALGITLRGEYIKDKDMIKFGAAESIFQSTLSFDIKAGPLTFIPELRIDNAKNEIFVKGNGDASKSTFSALAAVVYKF